MSDRKKMINELTFQLNSKEVKEQHYPIQLSVSDATKIVDLLKAQEPRVLTLEEVQNDCPDYVYIEIASGWIECCVKDEGESKKDVGYFVYGFNECFIKGWKEYGKTWRCWDKMPSDKQRKETPWDGD